MISPFYPFERVRLAARVTSLKRTFATCRNSRSYGSNQYPGDERRNRDHQVTILLEYGPLWNCEARQVVLLRTPSSAVASHSVEVLSDGRAYHKANRDRATYRYRYLHVRETLPAVRGTTNQPSRDSKSDRPPPANECAENDAEAYQQSCNHNFPSRL